MCEKHNKLNHFRFGGGGIHNVLRNFLLYVFLILFNIVPHKMSFNSGGNAKKMVPKHDV